MTTPKDEGDEAVLRAWQQVRVQDGVAVGRTAVRLAIESRYAARLVAALREMGLDGLPAATIVQMIEEGEEANWRELLERVRVAMRAELDATREAVRSLEHDVDVARAERDAAVERLAALEARHERLKKAADAAQLAQCDEHAGASCRSWCDKCQAEVNADHALTAALAEEPAHA